jgi:hypothetical protein
MSTETDMNAISMRQGFFLISEAIIVIVIYPPQVRTNCHKKIVAVLEHATCGISNFVIEVFNNQLRMVRHSIAVTIPKAVYVFFFDGHVFPVMGAILINIAKPFILLAVFRAQGFTKKSALVVYALKRDRFDLPVLVATDIEFRILLAVSPGVVQMTIVIYVNRYGICNQRIYAPDFQSEAVGELGRHLCLCGLRQLRDFPGGKLCDLFVFWRRVCLLPARYKYGDHGGRDKSFCKETSGTKYEFHVVVFRTIRKA